jgi:anionic cell wall polymer biosynthesis LytR-Cps2A-Psr (LCP) family protein
MVSMAILYNLGIEIHHWVRVSFNGFVSAVNSLGGIDVEVPKTLVDECDEKMIRYPAGMNHLDGYRALCYARVRKASSDFARTKRQQQVLLAVFDKFLSREGLTQAPLLYKEFRNYFETDMRLSDFLRLIPLATAVAGDPDRVQGYTLDLSLVKPWRVPPTGAAVLLPERESIHSTLTTIFSQ